MDDDRLQHPVPGALQRRLGHRGQVYPTAQCSHLVAQPQDQRLGHRSVESAGRLGQRVALLDALSPGFATISRTVCGAVLGFAGTANADGIMRGDLVIAARDSDSIRSVALRKPTMASFAQLAAHSRAAPLHGRH